MRNILKRCMSIVIAFLMIVSVLQGPIVKAETNGTAITTADELINYLSNNPTGSFFLANDISLKGKLWTPVKEFSGILDGNGYSISYLTSSNGGLFTKLKNSASVVDLKLEEVNINYDGREFIGSIANYIYGDNVVIRDVTVTGNISARYSGGIVGRIDHGDLTIQQSCNYANLSGSNSAGIISSVYGGSVTIDKCINYGNVKKGICYYGNTKTTVTNSINLGDVECGCGDAKTMMNFINVGNTTEYGVDNSTSKSANYLACYYLREDTAAINSGIKGCIGESDNITALTRKQFLSKTNLSALDFDSIWTMVPGVNNGYPILQSVKSCFKANSANASVKTGTYKKSISVKLGSDAPNAVIYYTTNGDTPTTSSLRYSKAIKITNSTTLKVMVSSEGYTNSTVNTFKYKIKK